MKMGAIQIFQSIGALAHAHLFTTLGILTDAVLLVAVIVQLSILRVIDLRMAVVSSLLHWVSAAFFLRRGDFCLLWAFARARELTFLKLGA